MNYNFILQKNKYSFSYSPPIELVDDKLTEARAKEISFFLKELQLYEVTLKYLYKSRPSFTEKNQLLNIALSMSKDEIFIKEFKAIRRLNIKRLKKYTDMPKRYLEKWSSYLIAYLILFTNTTYDKISKYISIQLAEEASTSLELALPNSQELNMGIVLSSSSKDAVILTYHGEFLNIKFSENPSLGTIASGDIKKTLMDFRVPVTIGAFALVLFLIFGVTYYNISKSNVIIRYKSDYILTVNNLNRVINVSSSSDKGRDILKKAKMKHRNIDNAIFSLLKELENNNDLKAEDSIIFIVSGKALDYNSLIKSEDYLKEKNINASINNAGRGHSIK